EKRPGRGELAVPPQAPRPLRMDGRVDEDVDLLAEPLRKLDALVLVPVLGLRRDRRRGGDVHVLRVAVAVAEDLAEGADRDRLRRHHAAEPFARRALAAQLLAEILP